MPWQLSPSRPLPPRPDLITQRPAGAAALEDVQAEHLGKLLADQAPPDAVAFLVEGRGEDADPGDPRDDGDDAAADAALGGQAGAEGPLAGVVVHAAGEH